MDDFVDAYTMLTFPVTDALFQYFLVALVGLPASQWRPAAGDFEGLPSRRPEKAVGLPPLKRPFLFACFERSLSYVPRILNLVNNVKCYYFSRSY